MQLQITEVKTKTSSTNLNSIQIIYKENKIADFWKKIVIWNLRLTFKFKEFNNYKSWWDEVLMQALIIETKSILKNNEINTSDNLVNEDRLIWQIKNKILFNMLLSALKSTVHQIIKDWINENNKNAAELWTVLKTEYKTHITDTRLELI